MGDKWTQANALGAKAHDFYSAMIAALKDGRTTEPRRALAIAQWKAAHTAWFAEIQRVITEEGS
jgi:hypothetical protein